MLGLVPFGLEAAQRLEDGDDFSIALTPELRRDAWVAAPRMVSRNVSDPQLPGAMSSEVGSGMTQPSARQPRCSIA